MSVIDTQTAPKALGPYAQARFANGLLFVSGQLPLDPETGEIVEGDVADQLRQCIKNVDSIAQAAGSSLSACLKTTVLVTDLDQFQSINAAYGEFFSAPYPARAAYEVSALPKGAQIEIEAVILMSEESGATGSYE